MYHTLWGHKSVAQKIFSFKSSFSKNHWWLIHNLLPNDSMSQDNHDQILSPKDLSFQNFGSNWRPVLHKRTVAPVCHFHMRVPCSWLPTSKITQSFNNYFDNFIFPIYLFIYFFFLLTTTQSENLGVFSFLITFFLTKVSRWWQHYTIFFA